MFILSNIKHFAIGSIVRLKVIGRVGLNNFIKARKLRFCAFPVNPIFNQLPLLSSGYAIEKILYGCNIKSVQFDQWKKIDVLLGWEDLTSDQIKPIEFINQSYTHSGRSLANTKLINTDLHDISKKKMAEVNKKVFGYDLDVDPTTYNGKVVRKSDVNALHDGVVIDCPIPASEVKDDCVYNVCINNIDADDNAIDNRVVYIGGLVDFYYHKKRHSTDRFLSEKSTTTIKNITDTFSTSEINLIEKFCQELGAEYGEMDVLRDLDTGKIYIVDFAKTPMARMKGLILKDKMKAVELMAAQMINFLVK